MDNNSSGHVYLAVIPSLTLFIFATFLSCVENKIPGADLNIGWSDEVLPMVSNLSIISYFEENSDNHLIRMNISWTLPDNFQGSNYTNIMVESQESEGECAEAFYVFDYDLNKNFIIQPSPNIAVPEKEIRPGCMYNVTLYSDERINAVTYQVPECVGKICDCKVYKPVSSIVNVEFESQDNLIITWNPGTKSHHNKSYEIVDVMFSYRGKNATQPYIFLKPVELDYKKHFSKVNVPKIPKGEIYVLTAEFTNNYTCLEYDTFEFSVPENRHYTLIFLLVTSTLILIALKHQQLVKYGKKLFNIFPTRCNRMVVNDANISLSQRENAPPSVTMIPNVQYTPAEYLVDKYETPRSRVELIKFIDEGAFGLVYEGKYYNGMSTKDFQTVAIKISKGNIDKDEIDDFLFEIEIFKKIGFHPNIVELVGYCTLEMPYMMIMEFVPDGSLRRYLLDLRKEWLKRKSARVLQENSDGAYIEGPDTPRSPGSITSSRLPSTSETICTNIDSDAESLLLPPLYSNTSELILDHTELQNFALQIAKGMSHLEKIPITHRDLAARNILINKTSKVLKISDFGMSRKGPYVNHKLKKKFPLRWMAIESIVSQKYDCKSDVWSFGVVLWEISNLGAFPYENVVDSFISGYLNLGNRLERPETCTDEFYHLMLQCWAKKPEERPSFHELVEILDEKKRKVYVDFAQLNPLYVFPPSESKGSVSWS